MKDIEKLTKLFDEFGIVYSIGEWQGYVAVIIKVEEDKENMNKVGGYFDFYSHYLFDDNGKFIKVNIWE